MIRMVCLAAALAGLAGCGLIDAEVSEIDLDLSERVVTIDTADWALTDEGEMPSLSCADAPDVCGTQVEAWCGAADLCSARCGGETCVVGVEVALWHTFDLAREAPELEKLEGQPLLAVTVDRVSFSVEENTLNISSPELTVWVAPEGVVSIEKDGRGAEEVGRIPSMKAGHTSAETDLELTTNGQTVLAEHMRDYATPFNVIVGGRVELRAGDEVPTGRMKAGIKVAAHARTGL